MFTNPNSGFEDDMKTVDVDTSYDIRGVGGESKIEGMERSELDSSTGNIPGALHLSDWVSQRQRGEASGTQHGGGWIPNLRFPNVSGLWRGRTDGTEEVELFDFLEDEEPV